MTQNVAPDAPAAVLPSKCTLYLGDCTEVMATLAPDSVSLGFADLPYGGKHRKTTDMSWDMQVDLVAFNAAIAQLIGNCPLVMTATQPFAAMLIMSNLSKFRYDIIWEKSQAGGFFNANRAPLRKHEHLLIFSNKPTIYNPQMTPGKAYRALRKAPGKAFADRQTRSTVFTETVNYGTRYPTSVQRFCRDKESAIHPTQKPIALVEWLIKTYTNPGDTVLDPVFGSCTTGVACARLRRHFIGIEKDPEYFRIGTERVKKERLALGLCEAVVHD